MPGLGQRFFQLQFGKHHNYEQLYSQFTNYLKDMEKGGASLLNQMDDVHNFIDSGVRSQRSHLRWSYIVIHVQVAVWFLLFISNEVNQLYYITALIAVLVQYGICWLAVFNDRQDKFVMLIQEWSNHLHQRMIILHQIIPEIGVDDGLDEQFDERKFAKLWLRELSPSMNIPWKNIQIELLPSGNLALPAICIIINGKRKEPQHSMIYGFAEKDKLNRPNQLLKTLKMFATVNPIPFYGENVDREIIEKQIDRLRSHLINLFGKRDQSPITEYIEGIGWRSRLRIKDRTDLRRESIKRSVNTFGKILISYVGVSKKHKLGISTPSNEE